MPIKVLSPRRVAEESPVTELRFTLPYPPSANRYWRNYRGIMVTSQQALQYKAAARRIASGSGCNAFVEPVHVQVDVYRPAKRGDLDNTLKVLLDSLNRIAYVDDSQIVKITARRFEDKKNPRAEVVVKKYFQEIK